MSYFGSWGIIIDDVIFPDGRSAMGKLGGGGLYTTSGMRLWCENVRILSAVGPDFDSSQLTLLGLDASGLLIGQGPTPRAWQLFEENGRRTQISRVSREDWHEQLVTLPTQDKIDPQLRWAHFLGRGDSYEVEWVAKLKQHGIRLSAEPIIYGQNTAAELDRVRQYMANFEIFSPGDSEVDALVGNRPVPDQLRALAELGPKIINLRQGAAGSTIYYQPTDQFWHVPAAPATVVDVTGAGNAYCGGFLTGWIETEDIIVAAARAAVSAAMTIEQVGPRPILADTMAEAQRRAHDFRPQITLLDGDA